MIRFFNTTATLMAALLLTSVTFAEVTRVPAASAPQVVTIA